MVSLINNTSSQWFLIEGMLEKLIFEVQIKRKLRNISK